MKGRRISITVAAILGCAALRAADNKLQLKGSTELELPKPKRTIDTDRKLNDQGDRPNPESGLAPGRVNNAPLLNKKLLKRIDDDKNWIFKDPREEHFDSKTEDFMNEKNSPLYNNRFMPGDEEKTAVQKFLDRDRKREDKDKEKDNDRDSERSDRAREKESFLPKRDEDELKENTSGAGGIPKAQFETAIFKAGSGTDPFGGSPLDNKLQRNPFSESNFSPQKASTLEKDQLRQQQIAHEQEFNSILQSRPASAASFGKIDTLNPAADVGRLDLGGGAAGRRPDPYSVAGRGGPTIATFTDGGPASFGGRSEIGARNFADSLPSFGASKAAPSFAPTPAQIVPDRSSAAPPPIAPTVPMRKF